ncbi:MAG: metallophosphoesterase [Rhizobiales bacterium]|nr:metallophosphoesterase [Hyphomicrobiales bacterium]
MIRIAVIADPHVHDCTWRPEGTGLPGAIRSLAQTAASTHVFNESVPAFRAALDRAAQAGAKIVLLIGALTDDGQRLNIRAALSIVAEYRERHGLRVLMTPGNHDFFALAGRPQDKTFLALTARRSWCAAPIARRPRRSERRRRSQCSAASASGRRRATSTGKPLSAPIPAGPPAATRSPARTAARAAG